MVGISLPHDIQWERICVSEDMIDKIPNNLFLPPRWRTSFSLFKYKPDQEFQPLKPREITYLKLVITISGYKAPEDEVRRNWPRYQADWEDDVQELLDKYYPCNGGALIQLLFYPKTELTNSEFPDLSSVNDYPYVYDFEPKKKGII